MKITKISCGFVLDAGVNVTTFDEAGIERNSIPDLHLSFCGQHRTTIPNQHIKEFERKFLEAGGVIE